MDQLKQNISKRCEVRNRDTESWQRWMGPIDSFTPNTWAMAFTRSCKILTSALSSYIDVAIFVVVFDSKLANKTTKTATRTAAKTIQKTSTETTSKTVTKTTTKTAKSLYEDSDVKTLQLRVKAAWLICLEWSYRWNPIQRCQLFVSRFRISSQRFEIVFLIGILINVYNC